jgi:hypothetical protein
MAFLCLALAHPASAGFTAEATVRPGLEQVKKVVLVTAVCHEIFNCADVERRVYSDLARLKVPFTAVDPSLVRQKLLDLGAEEYTTELRQKLADAFGADAILELDLVYGEARKLGRSGSNATVKLRVVRPTGEILLLGNGAGRALNTVSSPESIAQETFERILKKAFGK